MTGPEDAPRSKSWFEDLGKWDSPVDPKDGPPVSVLRQELKYFVERRKVEKDGERRKVPPEKDTRRDPVDRRSVDLRKATPGECIAIEGNVSGLAFSGGGIRSATFGLGVLEGLKDLNLLKQFDYLSTVSGGGYLGAWLSANCLRAAKRVPDKDGSDGPTNWLARDADWKESSIAYLRRYSKYLSPDFGFTSADTWSMVTIWLRNTLLVQLTVILAIAAALLVPRLLMFGFNKWYDADDWRWTAVGLYLVAAVGIAGNQRRLLGKPGEPLLELRYWRAGLFASALLFAAAWAWAKFRQFEPFAKVPFKNVPADMVTTGVLVPLLLLASYCLLPVFVKLINIVWNVLEKPDPPERINYSQPWVQAIVVLPLMLAALLVSAVLWGLATDTDEQLKNFQALTTYGALWTGAWKYWPLPLAVAFVSFLLLSVCSLQNLKRPEAWLVAILAPATAVLVLHSLLCAIMLLLREWTPKPGEGIWKAFVWTPSLLLLAFSLGVVVLLGILGRETNETVREWWSRLGAWLAIYGFAWMLIAVAAVYGPMWGALIFSRETWHGVSISAGWLLTTAAGLLTGKSDSTSGKGNKPAGSKVMEAVTLIAPFVFIAGLLVAVATCLHLLVTINSCKEVVSPVASALSCQKVVSLGASGLYSAHWPLLAQSAPTVVLVVSVVTGLTLLLFAWRVDINEFSLNSFYRSRLIRCYLGATRPSRERKPQNFTGFDESDDLPMVDLRKSAGPLHIVNCSLNLGGSSDLALHTRHSASFTITPLAVGTHYERHDRPGEEKPIGFQDTENYGGAHGTTSLGKAISVSGAAASPNMGYHSSPVVAFVLTMFNARLGWWFASPRLGAVNSSSPKFSLRYLLHELLASADDRSDFLMISDGGHFENLAIYELIRRRCRVIVASDAECDPKLQFEGLGTLIRVCQVDFNVTIKIDVTSLMLDPDSGWSKNRCAVGKIIYDPEDTSKDGVLIYLKASMNGHEDEAIRQYKASHLSFPHESTGNQFYGEDQFESYRQLGREIVRQAFLPVAKVDNPDDPPSIQKTYTVHDLPSAAKKLVAIWTPSLVSNQRFAEQGNRLVRIWNQLGSGKDLHFFDAEREKLMAEKWPDEKSTDSFRPAYFVSLQIIQSMENVYMDLDLEHTWEHPDNQGWKRQFEIWAKSDAIKKTWEECHDTFGLRFQYFCNLHLELRLPKLESEQSK